MSAHLAVEPGGASDDDSGVRGDVTEPSFELHVSVVGTAFVLAPEGRLDGEAGGILEDAVAAAGRDHTEVIIDLGRVESVTPSGTEYLERCAARGARVEGGRDSVSP